MAEVMMISPSTEAGGGTDIWTWIKEHKIVVIMGASGVGLIAYGMR